MYRICQPPRKLQMWVTNVVGHLGCPGRCGRNLSTLAAGGLVYSAALLVLFVLAPDLTIGWSDRGSRLRWAKEGVDDWDKVPSFDAGEAPRRSTSSLDCPERFSVPHIFLGSARIEDPFALLRLASWVSVRVQGHLVARTLSALVRCRISQLGTA